MDTFVKYVKSLSRPSKDQKKVIRDNFLQDDYFCLLDFLANITFTTSHDGVCSDNLLKILKTKHFDQVTHLGVLEIKNDVGGFFEDLVKISTPYSTFKGPICIIIISVVRGDS